MGKVGELAMQAGSQAIGGIMGMIGANWNDKRQLKQAEKLQALQMKGQKEMSVWQKDLDLQMWKNTSYPAQLEMMKKAGINPALMYGMGGGGGTTTGGGAPQVSGNAAPTGGGEIMQGMGMQIGLMAAQTKLVEAQAENVEADTKKKQGVDTQEAETRIKSLTQGIENQKSVKELTDIQTNIAMIEEDIKGATQNAAKALVMQELRSSYEKMEMIKNDRTISDATVDEKTKIIEQELMGAYARNELTRAQIGATAEQIKKWSAEIAQGWANLDRQEYEVMLKKWEAEMKAQFPSIGQSMGKTWNDLIEGFKTMFDGKEAHKKRTYDAPKR